MSADTGPVPLRLPAILQNPTNPSIRQVEAHNAQQREKAIARRDRASQGDGSRVRGPGKRVIRRRENATFTSNPHVVAPTRADYMPSVPLQSRPLHASFPPSALPRSIPIPPVDIPQPDPSSISSKSGTFSTSLKGTRALLRKRGRRAEYLVALVEGQIQNWKNGQGWLDSLHSTENWKILDSTLVENEEILKGESDESVGEGSTSTRRMPALHQIQTRLPPLPTGSRAAVLELSRSPAHLTWAVADSFDRLVVHLVARYYELVSWSDDHITTDSHKVRLTHMVVPSLSSRLNPVPSHALLTPETSDLSGQSSSETPIHTESEYSDDDETETEQGSVVGYSLESESEIEPQRRAESESSPTPIPELIHRLDEIHLIPLERTISNGSSMYASESDPEGSEYGAMGDSLTLPSRTENDGGWTSVVYSEQRLPPPRTVMREQHLRVQNVKRGTDKPSFFEYLYGA
ncbi:hypothetical protein BCR39DRAFT_525918 [Naematelia encephala]|uniref:R3H-associated N-terminal domain-containing protein n=1 Tax=Naematelia encephala TaxID=71784 RepID=A0A1Y2BC00_9TREE|nr:hypothetical protein BCR39DRAFT_525918 [Naematelia encephala]